MAGHSHWAGIKHKKGRQDKERSKIFSKLSREITVAAKLGARDPETNPRLRTAIQAAKQSNMPKDTIERAINKSSNNQSENYQSLRYEGFGPFNVAFIIEALTDNKNRTASKLRTIFQKNNGRLGENGSTAHLFFSCGVILINRKDLLEEEIFDIAINSGAKDCNTYDKFYEIICKKDDFYKVKTLIEKKIENIIYTGIEWRANNYLNFSREKIDIIKKIFNSLEDEDDVQKVFLNCKIDL